MNQPTWSIERVVALVTPIFVAAAGWMTGAVAKYGIHLNKTGVASMMVAGAVAAGGAAIKWLDGRQKFMALERGIEHDARIVAPIIHTMDPQLIGQLEGMVKKAVHDAADAIMPSDKQEHAAPPPPVA